MANYLTDEGGTGDRIAWAIMENRGDYLAGAKEEESTREEIRRNSLEEEEKEEEADQDITEDDGNVPSIAREGDNSTREIRELTWKKKRGCRGKECLCGEIIWDNISGNIVEEKENN